MDFHGQKEKEEDLTSAQDTSTSGQLAQRSKLRIMAQDAALKEIAISRLRKLLA